MVHELKIEFRIETKSGNIAGLLTEQCNETQWQEVKTKREKDVEELI